MIQIDWKFLIAAFGFIITLSVAITRLVLIGRSERKPLEKCDKDFDVLFSKCRASEARIGDIERDVAVLQASSDAYRGELERRLGALEASLALVNKKLDTLIMRDKE